VTAEYDMKLVEYLDRLSKFHTAASLRKNHPHVDYIHMATLLGWVETQLILAVRSFGYSPDIEIKTITAFNKLLWIQNDIFARWYVRDGEEYKKDGANL